VQIEDPAAAGRKVAAVRQKATSCDLCTNQAEPSCVYACPHDAAHRVDPRKYFAPLLGAAGDSTVNLADLARREG
jgi:Fe-S-cluster-containing hydrogenase component 2